jgi:hypothetical protein
MGSRPGSCALSALAFFLLASCRSTPQPESQGITVRSVQVESGYAAVLDYTVAAPFERARRILLDFDGHAAFRPGMLESELMSNEGRTGTARFRLKGMLGMNPMITCDLTLQEKPGWLRMAYVSTECDTGVASSSGRFIFTAVGRSHTRIRQEAEFDAWLVTEARFLSDMRADAEAIRARMEKAD